MKMKAHLKLPSRSTVRLACTRYSNESDPTLRRPPRGREGGREGAPPPPARRLVVHFWFSHAFWRRRLRRRKERNGIARFSAIGNKSQSPLPLFFSIYRSIGRSRLRIELDVFRATAAAADHRLTRRAVSSLSLSLSLSNADLSLKRRSLSRCSLPPSAARERISAHSGSRPAENP